MQKLGKDEYWLRDEILRRNSDVPILTGMTSYEMLDACSLRLISELNEDLRKSEPEDNMSRFSETFHWFFTDVVAATDPDVTVDDQAWKIVELNKLIQRTTTFRNRDKEGTIILPTGDGNAIGFKDNPEKPLLLSIELHKALNEYNNNSKNSRKKIDVRIGLSTGPVYHMKDLGGNPNVWGPGIIYARRVMDLGKPRSILAAAAYADTVHRLKSGFKDMLHPIGNYPIKKEVISIFNVYGKMDGMEFGTKKKPIVRRIEKSAAESEIRKTVNTFLFEKVEIILEVKDPITMLTHHTWIWHVVNQTDVPVDTVFYYLEGDEDRDFPELNVRVTDEDRRELQIKSLNVNRPNKKEFFVQLAKPLKPRQKGRFIKLEHDWEDTSRKYLYRFGSDCRKFRFLLRVPKGMPISQKVAKVSPETGEIELARSPAIVRYQKDVTEVEWTASDIPAFDAYRFDW